AAVVVKAWLVRAARAKLAPLEAQRPRAERPASAVSRPLAPPGLLACRPQVAPLARVAQAARAVQRETAARAGAPAPAAACPVTSSGPTSPGSKPTKRAARPTATAPRRTFSRS